MEIEKLSARLIVGIVASWQFENRVIKRDPGILGGTPVFGGTRVPIRNLPGCLEGGYTIDEFLEDFPTVRKEHVVVFLEETKADLERSFGFSFKAAAVSALGIRSR